MTEMLLGELDKKLKPPPQTDMSTTGQLEGGNYMDWAVKCSGDFGPDYVGLTIRTYDKIARDYAVTATDEMRNWREEAISHFCAKLEGTSVLVPACGDGRDSMAFVKRGYKVTSFDLSAAMVSIAHNAMPQEVVLVHDMRLTSALNIAADGIFACGCMYHLSRQDFVATLAQFHQSLNPRGILFLNMLGGNGAEWQELVPPNYPGGLEAFRLVRGPRFYQFYAYDDLLEMFKALYEVVWVRRFAVASENYEFILRRRSTS